MGQTEDQFELRGKGAQAVGVKLDNGFLVRAGATARTDILPSGKDTVTPLRQALLSEGIFASDGVGLTLTRDHIFPSPSGAASVLLGRPANGWLEWKRADGATMSKAKRVSRDEQTPLLSESVRRRIIERHEQLANEGKLPTQSQLDRERALFEERFGPSRLAGLDGERLLTHMHEQNRDSLAYWLEFKNDDEFQTRRYGSIAGGSALKFRLFRRKETGTWQAGSDQANRPKDISVEEAISIARIHRDQLLAGFALLQALPQTASDDDYAQLQDQMDELVPDVSRLAWGHKYFCILFPERLDAFHSPDWQRYVLLKLLQLPPEGEGRYICAGRFMAAAREVDMPIVNFYHVLTSTYGRRHRYWRIGTRSGDTQVSHWLMMRDRSCIAVGWAALGDLSWVEQTKASREKLKHLLEDKHGSNPIAAGNDGSQLTQFIAELSEGDIVLAAEGATILGIGKVSGGYRYLPQFDFPHQREVEWLSFDEWKMPVHEGLRTTVREIRRHNENLLEVERRLQSAVAKPSVEAERTGALTSRPTRLPGLQGRIQSILERKGQVILYGPPGTGKTFWAERTANELAAQYAFAQPFDSLGQAGKAEICGQANDPGLVRWCCFHPAYGYEDFLEGYRPTTINGQVSFELRAGVFKKLCIDAARSPARNFYLIIDEINRGDIPRIFGELLTILENDKRGKAITLPVSQERFAVPENVFLIGTMNTADRSISLIDAALRRRFGFVELMPDGSVLKDAVVGGIALRGWLEALNAKIRQHVGRDARNLQIGHSYLMQSTGAIKDVASLKRTLRDDIIPLLEEYCYEDYSTLGNILGEQLVDVSANRIRHELFEEGQEDALIQGLLTPFPEIGASSEAILLDESQVGLDTDEDGDE